MGTVRQQTRYLPGWLGNAAPLLVYAGLVTWLTWPLGANLATHLPATNQSCLMDPPYMAAILARETQALTTAPLSFLDAHIFYPATTTLFYGDTGFGALPYFLPTFLLTGNPTLALNLLFLGGVALTAWAIHLVVVRWTGSQTAALIAGWTLVTTHFLLWGFVSSAPSYAILLYMPFIVLLAAVPAKSFRSALVLLPLIVLQCLTDVVYVAAAVLGVLGLLALARLARRATRAAGLRLVAVLAMSVAILLPVYLGHFAVRHANPHLGTQTFWHPSEPPPSLPWGPFLAGPAYLPPVVALLIAIGAASALLRWRALASDTRAAWKHSAFWAIAGVLLSLPPTTRWHQSSLRLPALIVPWAGLYDTLRVPWRLRVAALIGICLLVGLAYAECEGWFVRSRRFPRAIVPARACLAIAAAFTIYRAHQEGIARPRLGVYPIAAAVSGESPLIEILRRPGGPLLELPVGPGAGLPVNHARAMYRAIYHRRPLLNGYSSYWPAGFPERMDLARRLPEPRALAALTRESGLAMILVHTRELSLPELLPWIDASVNRRSGLLLVGRDRKDMLFSVPFPAGANAAPGATPRAEQ